MKDRNRMTDDVPNAEELRSAALYYATERGWAVFPVHGITSKGKCTCGRPQCSQAGKHPRIAGGFKGATTDPETIEAWWDRWPGSNVGMPTGIENGIFVIDADTKTPGAIEELESMDLPPAPMVRTGGGGYHIYFKYPEDFDVKTNANKYRDVLDVRGRGGYVLLAPSNHLSGRSYEWIRKGSLPEMPEWMAEELGSSDQEFDKFQLAAEIPEGFRDDTLFRAGCALRNNGLAENEIFAALMEINKRCKPPLTEVEVRAKARSAARYKPGGLLTSTGDAPITSVNILSRDELDEMKPPEWIIEKVLPKDSLSIVYGKAGAGKTFAVINMACALASGTPMQGGDWNNPGFPIISEGSVVYIAAEGAKGIKTRVQAWEKHHGVRVSQLHVVPTAIQLADNTERGALIDAISNLGKIPQLVIFDTLSRCMVGMDENSAQDVSIFIKAADKIKEELGCSVMIVHHATKDGSEERGSSALRGAADTMYKVSRNEANHIVVSCDKMKDEAELPKQTYKQAVYHLEELGSPPSLVLLPGNQPMPTDEERGIKIAQKANIEVPTIADDGKLESRYDQYWENQNGT